MCQSYINASKVFDFELKIAAPEGYLPDRELLAKHPDRVTICQSSQDAAANADLVVTDVWASMGQESEHKSRLQIFEPFQVNSELMALAHNDALFMHCLPAHRGEEVSADVIDGKHSVVWDEAENRLHSQQALLEYLCQG